MSKYLRLGFPYAMCIVLGVLLWIKWKQPVKVQKIDPISAIATVVKTYEDHYGRKHTTIAKSANAISGATLNDPTQVPAVVDSAANSLKIAFKEIDQVTKAKFVVEQKLLSAQRMIDSLDQIVFEYTGKFLTVRYTPKPTVAHPNGYFDYKYNGEFNMVDHTKEDKFLGIKFRKRSYTDFYFTDTAAYLTKDIKRITVQKQTVSRYKLQAAGTYNLQEDKYAYGPSFLIDAGIVNFSVNQFYWPQSKNWSTVVNAHLNLKSF